LPERAARPAGGGIGQDGRNPSTASAAKAYYELYTGQKSKDLAAGLKRQTPPGKSVPRVSVSANKQEF
jgi:hypothetical protein